MAILRQNSWIADSGAAGGRLSIRSAGLGGPGIDVSRDGTTLLYARTDDAATDLKLVEGFR